MAGRSGDLSKNLNSFLTDWRRELQLRVNREEPGGGRLLGKRSGSSDEDAVGGEEVAPQRKESRYREPSPLLVLPPPAKKGDGAEVSWAGGHRVREESAAGGSLVDRLIADLDEVNTIPFFDVQLPREIAVVIFGYLDMCDLCTCTKVSSSWHSLAEDNILWCRICHAMGYETNTDVHGHIRWKWVVREIVLRRKKVEKNWKERICGLSDHQPDGVGVLCSVGYSDQQILACYSSGEVYYWDLGDSEGPAKMCPSPPTPSLLSCCALTDGWGVVGSHNGSLRVFDTATCSLVHSLSNLGTVNSVDIQTSLGAPVVGVSSYHAHFLPGQFQEVTQSELMLVWGEGEVGEWRRSYLSVPRGQDSFKVTKIALVPMQSDSLPCPYALLYSTHTTLTLHPPLTPYTSATHILTSVGERGAAAVNCFDFTLDTVVCGTSAFGYRVQLFDLPTGTFKSSLHGHGQEVLCVNIASSPPNHLVSGSADKRVRVFDCRSFHAVLTLRGHSASVLSVQMDSWKVVSGSLDGTVIVWDQRMGGELWRSHDRHPVELCRFEGSYLVAANLPVDKRPVDSGDPFLCHRRQRGLVRVFDFSVDPLYYTKMLPSICSSTYDEPSASFYNMDLRVPYDAIT